MFDLSRFGEYLGETRYPPYADWKTARLNFLVKNRKMPSVMGFIKYLTTFIFGAGAMLLYNYLKTLYNF